MPGSDGSRLARWRGLVGLACRRVLARVTETERHQTLLAIGGVALAVALLLVVTSIGLGMLAQSTITSEDTDYWIVPEGTASSAVTDVEGQQLGHVHPSTARIDRGDSVAYATPVLMAVVRATPSDRTDSKPDGNESTVDRNESTYLVVLGVIPSPQQESLAGLPTSPLTAGDPYYAGGSYDGRWTGEAVLSAGAAEALGLSGGGAEDGARDGGRDGGRDVSFAIGPREANASRYGFSAVAVSEARTTGVGQLPVVLVHLSELQRVTGATTTDSADQILVTASDSSAKATLQGIYPGTEVVTRRGLLLHRAGRSKLPIAISVAALVISVVVGSLFLGTTLGMEIAAGSRQRAVLAALGFSVGSRVAIVTVQSLVVVLLGGLAGVLIAAAGVAGTNLVARTLFSAGTVGVFRPLFVVYGLGVALLIGVLALPYLVVVSWRSATTEVLVR